MSIEELTQRIITLEQKITSLSEKKKRVPKPPAEKTEKCERCGVCYSKVGIRRHKGCNGFVQPSKDVVVKALKKKVEIDKKNDSE